MKARIAVHSRTNATLILSATAGCHFYFARRVTFLSCADIRTTATASSLSQSPSYGIDYRPRYISPDPNLDRR
jgi:hypothetical protein